MSGIIRNILIVGTGSFLGGAARYAISLLMKNLSKCFPWATLAANLFGCLLIGILWAVSAAARMMAITGLCF